MAYLKIVKWVFVPVFFAGIIAAAIVNFYNADYAKNALDFFRARFLGGQSVEEVFIIAAKAGIHNIKVIISPCNLLSGEKNFAKDVGVPWYGELIENIRSEMLKYKAQGVAF